MCASSLSYTLFYYNGRERESRVSNPELYIIVFTMAERESRVSNPELYIILLQWQRERVESVIQSYTLLYYNGRERESSQ